MYKCICIWMYACAYVKYNAVKLESKTRAFGKFSKDSFGVSVSKLIILGNSQLNRC